LLRTFSQTISLSIGQYSRSARISELFISLIFALKIEFYNVKIGVFDLQSKKKTDLKNYRKNIKKKLEKLNITHIITITVLSFFNCFFTVLVWGRQNGG